jgi:hypothetical protein
MPAMFEDDMNLLLIFGAGIPPEAHQNAHGLWTQPSTFASMLKTLFTRLQDWELPIATPENCKTPIDFNIFPFVDFCPWLPAEKEHLLAAISSLNTYVVITRPLILLTFAERPSRAVMSGFKHARLARRGKSFLEDVCSLHLVSYEGHHSIQVACLHPSASRFSRSTTAFVTVIDPTFWLLLLTVKIIKVKKLRSKSVRVVLLRQR